MTLYKLSRAGLGFSILSIIAGAVVRATGSGNGCGSSWPSCNGQLIPSLNSASEQIEFSHRAISGLLLVITLIIFLKSFSSSVTPPQKRIINYLTFFVLFEALIGAVIVLYEWVGMNSSTPRIAAVPLHLVNTFGLLAMYAILFKVSKNPEIQISDCIDRNFKIATGLFILAGATGSITALADVLFPSESFISGLIEDFDSTSALLTVIWFSFFTSSFRTLALSCASSALSFAGIIEGRAGRRLVLELSVEVLVFESGFFLLLD